MAETKRPDVVWGDVFDKTKKAKIERNIVDVLKSVPIFETSISPKWD